MKTAFLIILFISTSLFAFAETQGQDLVLFTESMPYYGTMMTVQFSLDKISGTPECNKNYDNFPLDQSVAIKKALKWAKEVFDPKKNWEVQEISLKFVKGMEKSFCAYVVQLKPSDEMQSLPVGVLMDGSIVPPVKKK